MINALIAYDDNDSDLGDYFEASFNNVSSDIIANNPKIAAKNIRGLDCTVENVNAHINDYNGNRFMFIGLSHGNEEQLLTENGIFVSHDNTGPFAHSLFYTTACLCCSKLGVSCIENGCLTFIGYVGDAEIWEGYHDVFIECENYALKEFVSSEKSIKDSFDAMIEKHNQVIDELAAGGIEDTIVAAILVDNRDKLKLLGNHDLTINDLVVGG